MNIRLTDSLFTMRIINLYYHFKIRSLNLLIVKINGLLGCGLVILQLTNIVLATFLFINAIHTLRYLFSVGCSSIYVDSVMKY